MKNLTLATLIYILSSSIQAFSVFTLKPVDWSQARSVDLFVVGYGAELGNQFLYSAITKARVMDSQYPDSRVQVIFWAKEKTRAQDIKTLEERGLNILAANDEELTNNILFHEIQRLNLLSSLHIISHNAAFYGSRIQKGINRLDGKYFPWADLKHHFIEKSYVILHGCNTGFKVAPQISQLIERPVMGSLSSTDFQEIFNDNSWYHNNPGQSPSNIKKRTSNNLLFSSKRSCWKGNCHRLMPNNHPYRGYWGKYEVGLPFFKSFCNYRDHYYSQDRTTCYQGIAEAIRSWPTIEGDSFDAKVEDFLCPRYGGKGIFKTCRDVLHRRSNEKIFWGETLSCTLEGCDFGTKNIEIENGIYESITKSLPDQGNRPFLDEYQLFQEVRAYY